MIHLQSRYVPYTLSTCSHDAAKGDATMAIRTIPVGNAKLLATELIEGTDQQLEYFPVCFSRAGQRYHTVHLGYWTRFPNGRVSATRTICGTGDDGDPLGQPLVGVEDAITCPRCRKHEHAALCLMTE